MLDLRSQNIIIICKHGFYYEENENMHPREALKHYMSQMCYGDLEHIHCYSDKLLMSIVREVVLDFLRNANEGHSTRLIYNYFEASERYVDLDSWITALSLVQVREKNPITGEHEFINGFFHDCVINENSPNDLLYPEYERAIEYGKQFDCIIDCKVLYNGDEYMISRWMNPMKVKIEREIEDMLESKIVSVFDITKVEEDKN